MTLAAPIEGWAATEIGTICSLINGKAFKPSDWSELGLPIIRIQNLNNQNAPFNHFDGPVEDKFLVENGELLFAWSGTPGTSFGAHIWNGDKSVLNQHIFRVLFDETLINKQFLRFAINQKLEELINKAHGGVGLRHVTKGKFEATEISLPPLNEQRRIVAKIEALMARSARAKEALDAIPALLDRYRQSVLAAAFRGDLTADWRTQHPDVEPASELLEQIRNEHRDNWNAARRRGGYKGLSGDLPQKSDDLPDCWNVVTGGHLFQWGSGRNLPSKQFQEGDVPVFGGNGVSGYHSEALIEHPTIVIGRVGALCGNVYCSTGPCWVTDNAIYASYVPSLINLDFMRHAFQTANLNTVATGSGQPFVNQTILNATELPLPPLVEQDEICRLLADAFGTIEKVERAWKVASARLPDLNQSILAKAFRGELVPQDQNDEPASELLARINAERAAHGTLIRRGGPRKRASAPMA